MINLYSEIVYSFSREMEIIKWNLLFKGHDEIVEILVKHGGNIEDVIVNGWTPLQLASHYGHCNIVKFLINSGAKIQTKNANGWTPLHTATSKGHENIVNILIDLGAELGK